MTNQHTADATQGLSRFHSLDLLSTLIAVLRTDGSVQFANAALENTLGLSRRTLEGADFCACCTDAGLAPTGPVGRQGAGFGCAAL